MFKKYKKDNFCIFHININQRRSSRKSYILTYNFCLNKKHYFSKLNITVMLWIGLRLLYIKFNKNKYISNSY